MTEISEGGRGIWDEDLKRDRNLGNDRNLERDRNTVTKGTKPVFCATNEYEYTLSKSLAPKLALSYEV